MQFFAVKSVCLCIDLDLNWGINPNHPIKEHRTIQGADVLLLRNKYLLVGRGLKRQSLDENVTTLLIQFFPEVASRNLGSLIFR